MADFSMSVRAYCKMILHAIKYPHATVNGLLLAERTKGKDSHRYSIVDCIPLFHMGIGLAPMMEIALAQVEQYCRVADVILAGYYQANMNYKDAEPHFYACKIADKLLENFSDTCLVMIDNKKLSLECDEAALCTYHSHDGKWKLKEKSNVHLEDEENTFAALSTLMHTKSFRRLVDFDNHLDNISLSWQNVYLNEHIDQLV